MSRLRAAFPFAAICENSPPPHGKILAVKKGTLILCIILASIVNAAFVVFFVMVLHFGNTQPCLALFITFLMLAYHINVRLFLGSLASLSRRKIDVDRHSHRVSEGEFRRLEKLGVKKWKRHYPTLLPEQFALSNGMRVEEVIRSCANAERVHWLCFFFGFGAIPLGCAVSPSEWWLYLLTALFPSLLIELPLIIIQRYNRYRLYRLKDRIDLRRKKGEGSL